MIAPAAAPIPPATASPTTGRQRRRSAHPYRHQYEAASEFEINRLCWASGIKVEKGHRYTLWIGMNHPFFDQTTMTDVAGFRSFSLR